MLSHPFYRARPSRDVPSISRIMKHKNEIIHACHSRVQKRWRFTNKRAAKLPSEWSVWSESIHICPLAKYWERERTTAIWSLFKTNDDGHYHFNLMNRARTLFCVWLLQLSFHNIFAVRDRSAHISLHPSQHQPFIFIFHRATQSHVWAGESVGRKSGLRALSRYTYRQT